MNDHRTELGTPDRATPDSFDDALRELARAPERLVTTEFAVGDRIADHFRIEGVLGKGAMGVVFLAFDDRLQRQVAIKVHTAAESRALARLQREGRALARLSHPNVLAIHEVGTVQRRFFIATEYVDGGTAREFAEQPGRPWREIVEIYIQAAQGLAAAHAEGFVHRDFKPDNVLVGRDGRVRVADFGLARRRTSQPNQTRTVQSTEGNQSRLTRTDAVAGTPAYMAPEQLDGGEVTAAADQFALFVSLYEALYGTRPYGSVPSMAISPAPRLSFPARPRVPRPVKDTIARGLYREPGQRFDSMADVVSALRAAVGGRSRWAWAGAAAICLFAVGAWQASATAPCEGAGTAIDEVWSDPIADRLHAAFDTASPDTGARAWTLLEPEIQAFADQWAEQRRASCVATRVEGTQSDRLLERSMLCFDQRKAELEGVLQALLSVDRVGVAQAWSVVPSVESVTTCSDPTRLPPKGAQPLTGRRRRQALALVTQMEVATTLATIGQVRQGRDRIAAVVEQAQALADPAMTSAALLRQSAVLAVAGEIDSAASHAELAYFAARDAKSQNREVDAAAFLAETLAIELRDIQGAQVWLKLALRGLDQLPVAQRLSIQVTQGLVLQEQGHYGEAVAVLEQVLAEAPPDAIQLRVELLDAMGSAYDLDGQLERARASYEDGLELAETHYGPDTIHAAIGGSNLGLVLSSLGEFDAAIAAHERSIAIFDAALGPGSVNATFTRINLAGAYRDAGRCQDAMALTPDLLDAITTHQGPRHPDTALVLEVRGLCHQDMGQLELALADLTRATRIQREATDPGHPQVATYALHTAVTLERLGRFADAKQRFAAALEIWAAHDLADREQARLAEAGLSRVDAALSAKTEDSK